MSIPTQPIVSIIVYFIPVSSLKNSASVKQYSRSTGGLACLYSPGIPRVKLIKLVYYFSPVKIFLTCFRKSILSVI